MSVKTIDMHTVFEELNPKNQDIMVLLAKTIKVAQDAAKQSAPAQ